MTTRSKKESGVLKLSVQDEMTVYTAAMQKDELLGYLEKAQGLELDLSAVNEIDGAGLQVLLVLKKEADMSGKELRLTNYSQTVAELAELVDLDRHFGSQAVVSTR